MAELKNMTVQALRDLARKALGRGHSKLKTKTELIEALQAAQKKVAGAAEKAATKVKEATGRTAKATGRAVENVRGKAREATRRRRAEREAGATVRAGGGEAEAERPSVAARASSAAGQAARDAANAVREVADAARQGAKRVRDRFRGEREPDPAGYIVARVAGEAAARSAPHALTESALETERAGADAPSDDGPREGDAPSPESYDERLGDLPWTYGDDALIALPRDPTTLFFYWDHAPETLRSAFDGLDGGRPQLWIYAREPSGAWTKVREVDFALESRSYYIHDLHPGRIYRAEIRVVDRAGRTKLLPRTSNEMMLPPVGPSPVIDDRFMRILWSEPLQRLLRAAIPGGAFPEDVRAQLARLSDWSRFQSSAGGGVESAAGGFGAAGPGAGGGGASGAGGIGGRPTSPWVRPSSSGMGPWGGKDGEGR
jgi:uncharacterized protein